MPKNYKGILKWVEEKVYSLGTPIDDKILETYPEEDSNIGTNTFMSNWLAKSTYDFYEKSDGSNKDRDGYGKTYVKGESELLTRLMGLPPRYTYENTTKIKDGAFREDNLLSAKDDKNNSWENVGFSTYDPSESPIIEVDPNVFEVNSKTEAGINLQDRIDLAYSRAIQTNEHYSDSGIMDSSGYEENYLLPDEYRNRSKMLKGEEPLLGDIYFEEDGAFRDLWNLNLDRNEIDFGSVTNMVRGIGAPIMTENKPVIKGMARNRITK